MRARAGQSPGCFCLHVVGGVFSGFKGVAGKISVAATILQIHLGLRVKTDSIPTENVQRAKTGI